MTTSSYQDQTQYTGSVERDWNPKITPSGSIPREKAKELLDPNDPENLNVETNGQYSYVADHVSTRENREPKQGWTEKKHVSDLAAGGAVRNALLSGSYGELRKLRVDSEVNSETVTTSWSASIGENLRVGKSVGVAGYLQLGNTQSLVTSSRKGVDPVPGFAPNEENVPDLRLIVSDSALVQKNLYVKDSASISGTLDVKGDTRLAANLYVTGNTELTGTLQVEKSAAVSGSFHVSKSIYGSENFFLTGNSYVTGTSQVVGDAAVSGGLHVSKSIYGSENFFLTGNSYVTGNSQVVGNEAVSGSLHVSKSIYGSENLLVSGNVEVTKSLHVAENASISGTVNIRQDLFVTGNTSISGTLNVSGNTDLHSNLSVDHSASVLDLYVTKSARVGGNLGVTGNEYLSGSLYVKKDAVVSQSLFVNGDGFVSQNFHVDQNAFVAGNEIVSGTLTVSKSAQVVGDLDVTGSVRVSSSLYVSGSSYVSGNSYISGNAEISNSLIVHGDATIDGQSTFWDDVFISGNLTVSGSFSHLNVEELLVKDKSITVASGAVTPAQADGAGIDIAGAKVEFRYTSSTDRMGLNKGLDVAGDVNVSGTLKVVENTVLEKNLVVSGNTQITGNLGVKGDVDIQSSHFSMSNASILNGSASFAHSVDVPYLHVSSTASIKEEHVTQSFVENLVATQSTFLTQSVSHSVILSQSVSQSYVRNEIVTQSLVLTQSVSQSTVLSQSVTTQSVNLQHVNSSSVEQLNVKSGSVKDIQIVSGNASYIKVEKLEVTSTESAEFRGDVIVHGNISSSNSGSFKNLEVENNVHVGNSASVDKFLNIGGNGNGNSIVVGTGSIEASKSDLTIHNITGSGVLYMQGLITGSFKGDGRGLTGVTASVASSSTWKSYIDFEAGSTQSITHPFQTTDVFVQVYRWDDPNFHPDLNAGSSFSSPATRVNDATVKVVENGLVEISYGSALNGYAVISDAGMIITASVDLLQVATDRCEYNVSEPKAIYRFDHKLGTTNVIVSVYQYADPKDGSGIQVPIQIFPEQISIPDKSHIDIVFGRAPISGYVVIAKAGHVIKQFDIGDYIDTYNLHWGTEGNWLATSFTANTMSGDVVVAANYIDTHKIGNLNSGPQYYYQRTWGSYTEYTDTGINEYVRYSADDDADVRQVSNIDKNGDLTIRGHLITNGTFSTSDIRKKFNVETLSNALENVEKMRGVQFQWTGSEERGIGVIAQEVNTIYPELTKVVTNLDGSEQMVVNYEGLIGVLIEAVKNLSTKVSLLERQILKNENR